MFSGRGGWPVTREAITPRWRGGGGTARNKNKSSTIQTGIRQGLSKAWAKRVKTMFWHCSGFQAFNGDSGIFQPGPYGYKCGHFMDIIATAAVSQSTKCGQSKTHTSKHELKGFPNSNRNIILIPAYMERCCMRNMRDFIQVHLASLVLTCPLTERQVLDPCFKPWDTKEKPHMIHHKAAAAG